MVEGGGDRGATPIHRVPQKSTILNPCQRPASHSGEPSYKASGREIHLQWNRELLLRRQGQLRCSTRGKVDRPARDDEAASS